jgi:hypothetical protein
MTRREQVFQEFDSMTSEEINERGFAQTLAEKYGYTNSSAILKAKAEYFASKSDETGNAGMLEAFANVGVEKHVAPYLWIKTKKESVKIDNPHYVPRAVTDFSDFWGQMISDIKSNVRVFKNINYTPRKEGGLLVISPADVHIGKLTSSFETGDEYNCSIAVQRVQEGVRSLIEKARGKNVEKVLLVIGNDILHIDSPKRVTTGGTPQDTCGMWYDNFVFAKRLYYDIIMELREIAPIHIQFNPSNHDFMSGFHLSQVVEAMFMGCEDITFDVSMSHRKYYKFGKNLIGTSHGDGAKMDELALLMAHDSPHWTECTHRYFYLHHFHHKIAKDKMSVQIEVMRTVSGTDGWHHRKGFQYAPKAMEAFLHHPEYGQTDRMIHYF